MTDLPLIVLLPLCFLGGLVLGFGYFLALRETARLIVGGGNPLRAIALTLGRIALLGASFFTAVLFGGLALLAAFGGVLCAKSAMLQKVKGAEA